MQQQSAPPSVGANQVLARASPTAYALTGSDTLDFQSLSIPFLLVITMAMSGMLVNVWQSFLSVQLAKIGLNPTGGSLWGTLLVTSGVILATVLLLKLANHISWRATIKQGTPSRIKK